jgi:hypothetical protein
MQTEMSLEEYTRLKNTPCNMCGKVKRGIMHDADAGVAVCPTCASPRKKGGHIATHAVLWPLCPHQSWHDSFDHANQIIL